jgi:flagellar hook-associated protein 2
MGDIYIPGVNSRFDTAKMIEDLMKLERVPRDRAQKNLDSLEQQKGLWQEVGRRAAALRESAGALFSFQNPFNDRVAASADPAVLSGAATREAAEQEKSITVRAVAAADRFISAPQPKDYRVPAGDYRFTVGNDEVAVDFRGGSLSEFADALTRRGKNLVRASVMSVQVGTQSLILEAVPTGAENRLGFKAAAETFALAAGIVRRVDDNERVLDVSKYAASAGKETRAVLSDGAVTVAAGGAVLLPVSPGIRPGAGLTLELSVKATARPTVVPEAALAPTGPNVPSGGSASYGGVNIANEPSAVPLPEWTPPPVPPRTDDLSPFSLVFADGTAADLPAIRDSAGFETYDFDLAAAAAGKEIVGIELTNRNTDRDFAWASARIFDPAATGGLKAVQPISTAGDARLTMDGIDITRPTNAISDLIPGVTVNLLAAADKPVKLKIEPDRAGAKKAILDLVDKYDKLMEEINVLTRTDEAIVNEITHLEPAELEALRKQLGLLQGDSTLNQLRTSLQRLAANPYPTSAERAMTLLSQLGVATDTRGAGAGGLDVTRLRGYLEVNEAALDQALKNQLPAVKELFGADTNGDLINDNGFAYSIDALLKAYVQTGGVIGVKTTTLDGQVAAEKRSIETYDQQLVAKEAALKQKYGTMEGALNRMDATAQSIDRFGQQNNN